MADQKKPVFLTAEWRKLVMVNYPLNPEILAPFVPPHTELDFYAGKCFVSLIGFMFLHTKMKGIPIPFHQNFEEVNLRFYVRYKEGDTWRRGAVFIKEIVPKFMISLVANTLFGEKYETRKMNHEWILKPEMQKLTYRWKTGLWNSISVETEPIPIDIVSGSEEEFISEHYWGYTQTGQNKASEYAVEHPKWQIYKTTSFEIEVDFGKNYGPEFSFLQETRPSSVFVAEGSKVLVRNGRLIADKR